jgi:hypothetical protein
VRLIRHGNNLTLERESGEARVVNESDLFYRLRNVLRQVGEDVIKKEMSKDGHMVSDRIFYVRSRRRGRPGSYAIWDRHYATRDAAQEFNYKGSVTLSIDDLSDPDATGPRRRNYLDDLEKGKLQVGPKAWRPRKRL